MSGCLAQELLGIVPYLFPILSYVWALGLQTHTTPSSFTWLLGDLNSGLHAYITNISPIKSLPLPFQYVLRRRKVREWEQFVMRLQLIHSRKTLNSVLKHILTTKKKIISYLHVSQILMLSFLWRKWKPYIPLPWLLQGHTSAGCVKSQDSKLHIFNSLSFTLVSPLMAQLWSQVSLFPYVFRSHFSHFHFKVTYQAVTRNGSCILIFWMISWLVTFSFSDYFWSLSFSAATKQCQTSEDRELIVVLCL